MTHRSLPVAALLLLSIAACSDSDAPVIPSTYRGQEVLSMETDISNGQRATFYFTKSGFLPMATKRVEIVSAGPEFETRADGAEVNYRWAFSLKFAAGAKPESVVVENVGDRRDAKVLLPRSEIKLGAKIVPKDGKLYAQQIREWKAVSPTVCKVAPGERCSAWMYGDGSMLFGEDVAFLPLRFVIRYQDRSEETIYQGVTFRHRELLAKLRSGGGERTGVSLPGTLDPSGAPFSRTPPEAYQGQPVQSSRFETAEGDEATLYLTDAGFLPAASERASVRRVGLELLEYQDAPRHGYALDFALRFADDASPVSVKVEHVSRTPARLLVPETEVALTSSFVVSDEGKIVSRRDSDWSGVSAESCRIDREEHCGSWLYGEQPTHFAFRITIGYKDGTRETLYQGATFDPKALAPHLNPASEQH
ncbi:MAG: hypothetical protein E6Q88_03905 [Lysobacteraceae bacterium]|nr:MAG: hypothetical protein E6Q88_03905 [Xanthomonadaceae bacterium]